MAQRRTPDGIMACKDGYVVVVTPEEHQWRSFMKLIGDPPWSNEWWCRDRIKRTENVEKIKEPVLEWMKDRNKEDIFRKGQSLSVPVAPVNTAKDVVESPQFNAREFFVETEHPAVGKIEKFPSSPYRFSRTPWKIFRPAPRLGEHNEAVFCGRLGYGKDELTRFQELGII